MIPGLENAEFVRLWRDAPKYVPEQPGSVGAGSVASFLSECLFAGQITGFEGYVESMASGLLAARAVQARLLGKRTPVYPDETMCGSLLRYIATPTRDFQPMGANMGILPSQEEQVRDKRKRYEMLAQRAVNALQESLVCE